MSSPRFVAERGPFLEKTDMGIVDQPGPPLHAQHIDAIGQERHPASLDDGGDACRTLVNNRSMSRYELPIAQGVVAVAYYALEDGRVVLRHTEVPSEFSGQGIGKRLARAVFETLRAEGKRVIAKCPFMASYAARNPQYAAMLDG